MNEVEELKEQLKIQQKQIERLFEARNIEKARADKLEKEVARALDVGSLAHIRLGSIRLLLKVTRKKLDKACKADCEYTTRQGKGVNCWEASDFFREIEQEIDQILNESLTINNRTNNAL